MAHEVRVHREESRSVVRRYEQASLNTRNITKLSDLPNIFYNEAFQYSDQMLTPIGGNLRVT